MIRKVKAVWALFQAGKVVADPAKWKRRQIGVTAVAGVLWALIQVAEAYGFDIPVGGETVDAIAGGVVGITNVVLTLTTSDKVGLRSRG